MNNQRDHHTSILRELSLSARAGRQIEAFRRSIRSAQLLFPAKEPSAVFLEHLNRAEEYLLSAEGLLGTIASSNSYDVDLSTSIKISEALIAGMVEIDQVTHPKIDPNQGWVEMMASELLPEGDSYGVDTQLMRLFFGNGGLCTWAYKPRRVDLCSSGLSSPMEWVQDQNTLSSTGVFTTASPAEVWSVLRRSKDIQVLRSQKNLPSKWGSGVVYKDFIFKAGIGAHLPCSTTGFSIELWMEGLGTSFPEEAVLVQQWLLTFPGCATDSISFRLLQSFGGISEHAQGVSDFFIQYGRDVPAGLHGLRVIDGLESLVIDFRTAHGLRAVSCQKLFRSQAADLFTDGDKSSPTAPGQSAPRQSESPDCVLGLVVSFYFDVHRMMGIDWTNTLFVSIL